MKVKIKEGPFRGQEGEVMKQFTSMIKGNQTLVSINDKKIWFNTENTEKVNVVIQSSSNNNQGN